MKKGDKKLLVLLGLLIVVGVVFFVIPSDPVSATAATERNSEAATVQSSESADEFLVAQVGDEAPLFSVEMLSGTDISLESLRGKVVLINFWATWYPPCQKELKCVQTDLIDRFAGRDFVFLPISRGEERAVVAKFLEQNGYTFDVGLDPEKAIFDLYATNYIPRNFLINRHGVVAAATVGYEPEEFAALVGAIEMNLNAR